MPLGNPITIQNESRVISVTADASQSTFEIDGGYVINYISVYQNGIRLVSGAEYTANNGSTVVLVTPAAINDTLEFHIYDTFQVPDAIVSAASTQVIFGDLTVLGVLYSENDVVAVSTVAANLIGSPSIVVDNVSCSGVVTTTTLETTGLTASGNSNLVNLIVSGNSNLVNVNSTGIVTAISFEGDGSSLTGVLTGFSTSVINAEFLNVSGVSTLGIVTGATYYGDGSNLLGVNASFPSNIAADDINTEHLTVSGVSTLGVVTGATYYGDGSNLTGVNVDGSALTVENDGVSIGIAGTINFGSGLTATTVTSGVTTVSSSAFVRTSKTGTTGSIVDEGSSGLNIADVGKTYILQKIVTDAAAWVTVYTSDAARTDDSTRPETQDPDPGSGVIAEIISTGPVTQNITPGTIGWNDESTPSNTAYLRVVNKSGVTTAIGVTLHVLPIEE